MDNIEKLPKIVEQDSWLEPATADIIARHNRFTSKLSYIESISGGIEQFSKAYEE